MHWALESKLVRQFSLQNAGRVTPGSLGLRCPLAHVPLSSGAEGFAQEA